MLNNSDKFISDINLNADKQTYNSRKAVGGKPKKNFEEVMRKGEGDGEQKPGEEAFVKGDKDSGDKTVAPKAKNLAQASANKGVSLFDLPHEGKEPKGELAALDEDIVPIDHFPERVQKESLSALFMGLSTGKKLEALPGKTEPSIAAADLEAAPSSKQVGAPIESKEPAPFNTLFSREQPDYAAVNPMGAAPEQPANPTPIRTEPAAPVSRASEIKEVIDQIVDKLYTVKTEGQTDTVMTLRHPPMFADAKVVIKSFETAKGEFNISFENLTQQSKNLLEMNVDSLKLGLEQKGFTIHIMTASTANETRPLIDEGALARGDREGEKGESGKQKEQNKERKG